MSDETGRVPTDEELVQAVAGAFSRWNFDLSEMRTDEIDDLFWDFAQSIRTALMLPVTPLAPGEVVTIPDAENWCAPLRVIYAGNGGPYLSLGWSVLDAAGIATLETVCRRARAALEGGK